MGEAEECFWRDRWVDENKHAQALEYENFSLKFKVEELERRLHKARRLYRLVTGEG